MFISGLIVGIIGLGTLISIGKRLGDRGLYADATHTSGYTTNSEQAIVIFGVTLIFISLALLMVAAIKAAKK